MFRATWSLDHYIYLLHRVIHRQKCLEPFTMQEVGELHVDWFHGACVLHDPMFVHIWGIVVARGARNTKKGQRQKLLCLGLIEHMQGTWWSHVDIWKSFSTSLYMRLYKSACKMPKNTCLLLFANCCTATGATVVHCVWHASIVALFVNGNVLILCSQHLRHFSTPLSDHLSSHTETRVSSLHCALGTDKSFEGWHMLTKITGPKVKFATTFGPKTQ